MAKRPAVALHLGTLVVLLAGSVGCRFWVPPARAPIPSEVLREAAASDCAAVLLPGRWDRMEAFRDAGFGQRAEAAGVDLGLVTVDAHLGYYRERNLVPRLAQDVVAPLLEKTGARRVWMVGTSLGGVGSLVYWRERPEEVAGLVLVAPYLGEEEVLDEVRRAGGLEHWQPSEPVAEDDFQRKIWLALQELTAPGSTTPVVLALGTGDDLAPGHRLLAQELPDTHVFRREGGHDWPTWAALWSDVLASGRLCGESVDR